MARFRRLNRSVFGPASLFIDAGHRVFKLSRIIDALNIENIEGTYSNEAMGRPAYPPRNLIKLVTYSYLDGVHSFRKIQRYCKENVVYQLLCDEDIPSRSTITNIWRRFGSKLKSLFASITAVACQSLGATYTHFAGDGVRLLSAGSREKIFNLEKAKKKISYIETKRPLNLSQERLLFKLKSLVTELESQKREPNKEFHSNRSISEPGVRLMKRRERYISGYNAQAVVEKSTGLILAEMITTNS